MPLLWLVVVVVYTDIDKYDIQIMAILVTVIIVKLFK